MAAKLIYQITNKAIKYAPVGRPTLLTSRGLWRRYANENMKRLITVSILAYLFSGCAHRTSTSIGEIQIEPRPVTYSEPVLHVVKAELIEPILKDNSIAFREAPFDETHYVCGGVVYSDQEEVRLLLESAQVVFKLVGVREEWVPINGNPKEYYVLKIE